MNSAIFDASISGGVRRCVKWFTCQVEMKARICDSASGPLVYRGYGYDMMSYCGSSSRTGKGLGSGRVTSGGLGGGFGGESTRDQVSGGEDCTGETSDFSGKYWSVTAESEVPSTGLGRRAGGQDLMVREGAVTADGGYLQRSSLCTHSCNRACQIVLPVPLDEHLQ